jgi:xylose isomerase
VTLALEYQPHEPHARILLSNVGKMLHVCNEVGLPNLGANLDIGHSFAAMESPAESAALLASKERLSYMHASDNTGDGGDWDMLSGSVHFWHWVELLLTMDKVGYDGWIGADLMAKFSTAQNFYSTNIRLIDGMIALIENIGTEEMHRLIAKNGSTPQIYNVFADRLNDLTKLPG